MCKRNLFRKRKFKTILDHLTKTYCGSIGVEFMYCSNEKLRQFLYERMEKCANKPEFSQTKKLDILKKLGEAVNFENFLQTKYIGKKRFSLEGLEVLIPALDVAIREAAQQCRGVCIRYGASWPIKCLG